MSSPQGASTEHTAVTINLNVNVDAQGKIEVFGSAPDITGEYIIAKKELPVAALYVPEVKVGGVVTVPEGGLIEFWEPSDNLGDIKCRLAGSDAAHTEVAADTYKATAKELVNGLQALLCDEFDCINAAPWSGYSNPEYTKQTDFGRVALSAYAHALFGHVDATAAITNDAAFVEGMLSLNTGFGVNEKNAIQRAGAYAKDVSAADPASWPAYAFEGSSTDANLAIRLVKAILDKAVGAGEVSSVSTPTGTLAEIVRQVLGQDPNRAINADNSERTLDRHMLLRFYENDVVYVSITLELPEVQLGASYSGPLSGANGNTDGSAVADRFKNLSGVIDGKKTYLVKITLGSGEAY